MKKNTAFFIAILAVGASLVASSCHHKTEPQETVITGDLRFNESTLPYNGGLLIANFGTEQLNPLNNEGKGYIVYYKEGKTEKRIPADGTLSGPKGMFEKDGYLYICDVNKVVVYSLDAPSVQPRIIPMPEGELFVNDLASDGYSLYISVTNTGNIYKLPIDAPSAAEAVPELWYNVTGANGLVIDNSKMYVASYPADGITTGNNVVYVINDLSSPVAEKLIETPGQYDGLALSPDKKIVYATNWVPAEIIAIHLDTKKIEPLSIQTTLAGPADISIAGGKLYIPDLPNSQVVVLPLPENK